jgi:hypothetical protein
MLERVEYRRADSSEEKEAIYRLRYEAYVREGSIESNPSHIFTDVGDELDNAWLIGIYIDGDLASSIRLHVASQPSHWLSAAEAFPDLIVPRLVAGDVIVDATRQTSRLQYTRAYPFLPLVTMRCGFLAMEYFGVDYLTGSCRAEYQPAFRRMFGSVTWGEPRTYPLLNRPHVLMAYDCKSKWSATRARYPFLTSTPEERQALFGRSSNAGYDLYAKLTEGRRARLTQGRQHSTTSVA